jgi:uncharacterized protein
MTQQDTKKITKQEACKFLLLYHLLEGEKHLQGDSGVIDYVEKVGCIQYDPLNVVGRNADLVLQSRVSQYSPSMLDSLLYEKRVLIDGWDKMMSIYLQKDWPYFQRVREAMSMEIKNTLAYRNSLEALELTEEIKTIIHERGPIQAKDISMGTTYSGSWGHSKMSSAALDYMYHTGIIGVSKKRNTQKIYDLIEELVPKELLNQKDPFVDDHDFDEWYIKRRIGSMGLLWGKSGGGWLGYRISEASRRKDILNRLVAKGELISIHVEGIKELFYLRKEQEVLLNRLSDTTTESSQKNSQESTNEFIGSEVKIIAPLDNLLWDRAMIEQLFGFSYTWEVYVPVIKRKYGYYVLPVLYKERFIARFEPELQRQQEPLRIKQWWWEVGVIQTPEMNQAILKGLLEFCHYLGASDINLPEGLCLD